MDGSQDCPVQNSIPTVLDEGGVEVKTWDGSWRQVRSSGEYWPGFHIDLCVCVCVCV